MPFRFAAKYGLLTYPQCGDLDGFEVSDMLSAHGAECIVGREDHVDGGVHLHAFFMFERKFESRDVRIFDVRGQHPNVVRGYGTPEKGWDYATKDGDIVAGGLARPSASGVSEAGGQWSQICMAESREEFFDLCQRLAPRALLCSFTSLRAYADWRFRVDPAPYQSPAGLDFSTANYPELDLWVAENLGRPRGEGTLVSSRPWRGHHIFGIDWFGGALEVWWVGSTSGAPLRVAPSAYRC
nr:MAG: replication associated protein [Genomoviridae sp.]